MNRILAVFLLTLFALGFAFGETSKKYSVPEAIRDSLPWFAVREITENAPPFTRANLDKYFKQYDRVAFVYFATWCAPCRAGVKKLAGATLELENHKVKVVLVNIGERDEDLIKKWVGNVGAKNITLIGDPFGRLTEGFGLVREGESMNLPQTLVVKNDAVPLFLIGEEGSDWPDILWK